MRSILLNSLATFALAVPFSSAFAQGGDPTIPDPQQWVRLTVASSDQSMTDEATLHFGIGEPGPDAQDVAKPDDLSTMPLYIAILADNGTPLALNAYGALQEEVVLPIQFRADAGDMYILTVRDLGLLNDRTCIALEDLETGDVIILEEGLQMDVRIPAGEPSGARFKLRVFKPITVELQHALCASGSNGAATVVPTGYGPWNITWLNYEQLPIAQQTNEEGPVTQQGLYPGAWTVVVEGQGCAAQQLPIFIEVPQELSISPLVVSPSCADGSNGSIQLQPAGGTAPYSFVWSNGSDAQDLLEAAAETYAVEVIDANGCTTAFSGLSVPAPEPVAGDIVAPASIGRFEPVVFSSTAQAGISRTWEFGDGTGSLVPQPMHAYQHLGIFTVRLTLNDGNCTTSREQEILVQGTVGVGEFESDEVRAWSAGGLITVNNPLHTDLHVHIFDATGRIITTTRIPAQTPRLEISTSGWNHGLYFLNASTPWEQWTFSLPVVE